MSISRQRVHGAIRSVLAGVLLASSPVLLLAQAQTSCPGLPPAGRLRQVLQSVVRGGASKNGGMGNQEWATIVNREGLVCAIVFSGQTASDQWPGSRMISAEKASTANAVSNRDFAISTANLYAPSQPGGSLYGIIVSSAPNPQAAFGNPATFGTSNDPLIGKAPGGVQVFGGGLPLYQHDGKIVGGLGLSGDTSCADHVIAWKVRHALGLDAVPMGPSAEHNDNMILDFKNNYSPSGFGHPDCKGGTDAANIIENLSKEFPTGPHHQ